jgi:hypothetical protein
LKIWWLIIQIPPFSRKWPILPGKYIQVLRWKEFPLCLCTLWIYRMTSLVSCCTRIVKQNKWPTLLHDRADVTLGYMQLLEKKMISCKNDWWLLPILYTPLWDPPGKKFESTPNMNVAYKSFNAIKFDIITGTKVIHY